MAESEYVPIHDERYVRPDLELARESLRELISDLEHPVMRIVGPSRRDALSRLLEGYGILHVNEAKQILATLETLAPGGDGSADRATQRK